jgi:error-prone DNA polymerase
LVRQRPGTAKGVCFITIEDETGNANLVVFENLFDKYRKEILSSRLLMVEGKLQIEGEVIHVIVQQCYNLSKLLTHLTASQNDNPPVLTLSHADLKSSPPYSSQNKKQPRQFRKKFFLKEEILDEQFSDIAPHYINEKGRYRSKDFFMIKDCSPQNLIIDII